MDRIKADRELIAYTISDLRESIDELESRIEMMNADLEGKKERLETWRRKLAVLVGGNHPVKPRRPKGENLRNVMDCLRNVITGLAASEIQRRTQLPWSSIQAILKRHTDLFVENNGLWRLRAAPKKTDINVIEEGSAPDFDVPDLDEPDMDEPDVNLESGDDNENFNTDDGEEDG